MTHINKENSKEKRKTKITFLQIWGFYSRCGPVSFCTEIKRQRRWTILNFHFIISYKNINLKNCVLKRAFEDIRI
jgi:hypothetical protein